MTSGPPFHSNFIPPLFPTPHPSLCSHHTGLLAAPQTYPGNPPSRTPDPSPRSLAPLQGLCTGSSLCLECSALGRLMAHSITAFRCFYVTFSVRLSPSTPYKVCTSPFHYFLPLLHFKFSSSYYYLTFFFLGFVCLLICFPNYNVSSMRAGSFACLVHYYIPASRTISGTQ